MTEVNPPAWEQAGTYSAQQDRMALMALLQPDTAGNGPFAPAGGVRPSQGSLCLAVQAQGTPNMTVKVTGGIAFVPATISENAGWICVNDGNGTVTITTASPSHPRIDAIIAHVYDASDDSGSLSEWALEAVPGAPAASPAAPALPANALLLAYVTVPTSATSIVTGNISDKRVCQVAAGGIEPSLSTALPPNPFPGQAAWCADTGQVLIYQGPASPHPGTWQSAGTGPGPWVVGQAHFATWTVAGTWTNYDISHSGAGWLPRQFTVPPSGSVFVTVTAGLGNTGTATSSIGFSINDPGVGDTGPNFVAFAGHNAVTSQDGPAIRASARRLITGLTPGKVLTAYPGYFTTGGSPVDDGNGDIMIEPVP